MTALQTGKKLGGLTVRDTAMSMRRKAMRDGGDNAGVEAANFGITALQQTSRAAKTLNEKGRQFSERYYEQKLKKLNNAKKLEKQTVPKSKAYEKKTPDKKRKKKSGNQKQMQKKKIQRKVYNRKKQEREILKSIVNNVKGFVMKQAKGAAAVVAGIAAIVLMPMLCLTMCGGGGGTASSGMFISPLGLYNLGLIDIYYTYLARDMIETHQNIEDYYVDYDKYVCLTEIDEIKHSPAKLVPCIMCLGGFSSDSDTELSGIFAEIILDRAKENVEAIFNAQYEFYTNEIQEVRKDVKTVTYSNEDPVYSAFGKSEYNLERPEGANIPNPLKSSGYTSYAHTYVHVEVPVCNGYINNTLALDDIGDVPQETEENHMLLNDVLTEDEYRLLEDYYLYKEDIAKLAAERKLTTAAMYQRIHRIKQKIIKNSDKFHNILKE